MGRNDGFFQLLLLGIGVMVVFTLIAYMADPTVNMGISGPWAEVNALIAPLMIVICFLGFVAYVVTHR